MSDKKSSESFIVYERSGAVDVDLNRYLQTERGKSQLQTIERLRLKARGAKAPRVRNKSASTA